MKNYLITFLITWIIGYMFISLGFNEFNSPISIILEWDSYTTDIRFAFLSFLPIWFAVTVGLIEPFEVINCIVKENLLENKEG